LFVIGPSQAVELVFFVPHCLAGHGHGFQRLDGIIHRGRARKPLAQYVPASVLQDRGQGLQMFIKCLQGVADFDHIVYWLSEPHHRGCGAYRNAKQLGHPNAKGSRDRSLVVSFGGRLPGFPLLNRSSRHANPLGKLLLGQAKPQPVGAYHVFYLHGFILLMEKLAC
jgi:hypothetical protein